MELETARAAFAAELRYVAQVSSARVIAAFASVPRERFLGKRPWLVAGHDGYWEAPADDPAAACHNVLFAIDPARQLNNGQPEFWARLLDRLDIQEGETLCHVGAGTGYYAAIMAEVVGPAGRVTALEIDAGLAARAKENLAPWSWVSLLAGDGASFDPGAVDVLVVNAGATHPLPQWLDCLRPGGRLLLPLTAENGHGSVFRFDRLAATDGFGAAFVSPVGIYACEGARSAFNAKALATALAGRGQRLVRSLRRDEHPREAECWLHGPDFCLSTRPPEAG
jgi:protein-L-isoaspartate(D-aspartate) O-methyltransferase